MLTIANLAADALGAHLAEAFQRTFGVSQAPLAELIGSTAQIAIECIGSSDALYHNVEHTMLVTLVGVEILRGRALLEPTTPGDWAHLIVGCLLHDIGYVRGLLKGDERGGVVVDGTGRTVAFPRGASDAALTPYHVDRAKLFVLERFAKADLLDATRIAAAIEFTRFPAPAPANEDELGAETGLLRAADLIGQLGDPLYLRKAKALFCEFEEIGVTRKLGYETPADLVEHYPEFFWSSVSQHLTVAIRYLNVTVGGRQWIASLHNNVFCAERNLSLLGPQR